MLKKRIRIVIIDPNEKYRDFLGRRLSSQDDFQVTGFGCDGYEAVKVVETCKPDVVLIDIDLPLCDGVRAGSLIKKRFPLTSVIIHSGIEERRIFSVALSGISGFITKKTEPELLYQAIRTVYHGGHLWTPDIASRLEKVAAQMADNVLKSRGELRTTRTTFGKLPVKTGRDDAGLETSSHTLPGTISSSEIRIISFVGQGFTNKQIAARLNLSEGTIRNYLSTVLQKTGLRDRTQVAIYAVKSGLEGLCS
ncbi:MAG: response regulator transcription factor [Treponema sp.]|nr:response regulator transcription factor [Treponema sp.]